MTAHRSSGGPGDVRQPWPAGAAPPGPAGGQSFPPVQPGPGVPAVPGWPRRSSLELGALPGVVPCARLHTRQVLWEWHHGELAEAVELLVSELVTNAVQASSGPGAGQHDGVAGTVPVVRFWLAADGPRVLIQVRDGCDTRPRRQQPEVAAESGRGLLLVEALSEQWGCYAPAGWPGKVTWALVAPGSAGC